MRLDMGAQDVEEQEQEQDNQPSQPDVAGGMVKGHYLPDDLWLGLALHTFDHMQIHDRRFHDAPGRHLNPMLVSNHSLVVHRVNSRAQG